MMFFDQVSGRALVVLRSRAGILLFAVTLFTSLQAVDVDVPSCIQREINQRLLKQIASVECSVANQRTTMSASAPAPATAGHARQVKRGVSASSACMTRSDSQHSLTTHSDVESISVSNESASSRLMISPATGQDGADTDSSRSFKRARIRWDDVKDNLQNCHRGFLIDRIHSLQSQLDAKTVALRQAKRQNKRTFTQKEKLQVQLHQQNGQQTDTQALCVEKATRKGKPAGRFSARGYIALGIRKGLSVSSAVGFPLAALVDVSRQTVTRSEQSVWAMLASRTASFHNKLRDNLRAAADWLKSLDLSAGCGDHDHADASAQEVPRVCDGGAAFALAPIAGHSADSFDQQDVSQEALIELDVGLRSNSQASLAGWVGMPNFGEEATPAKPLDLEGAYSLSATSFCGDATNSGIWRRCKLQGLLITSAVMKDSSMIASNHQFMRAFAFHTTVLLALQQKV